MAPKTVNGDLDSNRSGSASSWCLFLSKILEDFVELKNRNVGQLENKKR